ncbi:MAG TPA: RHS repeat-associated core domain-containing protein [Pyrinomonadaceae bacterium]|nr:RHS repeat-associated core domain-containing protein [Pyrinomonadaceae bacterium]
MGTVFLATDGSGSKFISDENIILTDDLVGNGNGTPYFYPSGVLKTPDGISYRIDNGLVSWIQDRNGNRTTLTNTGFVNDDVRTNRVTSIKDTLNREIVTSSDSNHEYITYNGFGGADRTITLTKCNGSASCLRSGLGIQYLSSLFAWIPFNHYSNRLIAPDGIKEIELANGEKYKFFYNSYLELARLELPTGAAVEYDYETVGSTLSTQRRLVERRVYPDGTNLGNKTTYEYSDSIADIVGNTIPSERWTKVKIFDALNDLKSMSKTYFYGCSEYCQISGLPNAPVSRYKNLTGREFKTEVYDSDGTTLLRKAETSYEARRQLGWAHRLSPPYVDYRVTEVVSTLSDTSSVSKITNGYDSTAGYNLLTDVFEYDYGFGSPGAFMRRTHTEYLKTNPVNNVDYTSDSYCILNLPAQKWVSTDAAGENKVSLTTFEYDNYGTTFGHAGLVSRSNVTGHDTTNYGAGFLYRGNVTAVTSYANAGNQTGAVTTYAQYDILGNVVKTIDANGNATTINYADNFGSPDGEATTNTAPSQLNGDSTFAFPTSTTNPMNWTSYAQYDYFTGKPVNTRDINGVISKTIYNDPLDRATQSVSAVGTGLEAQTTVAYDDSNHKITTTKDLNTLNDNLLKTESFYDGFGRTTEFRKYESDGNYVAAQTQYDALGRPYKTSNPFRPTEIDGSHPILWTQSYFDALGRITKIKTPDNAEALTAYSGNAATVTDQAGKVRRSITNALGQLVRVDEPNAAGQLGSISSPNQATYYSYDTLNNLTTVNQGVQTRTFSYDSLSRVTQAVNPESGTINYNYDANGNLTSKTDARSITTTNAYDALNRVITRSYSDPTPAVSYTYDDVNVANSKGKLTKVSNSVSETKYTGFDSLGRILSSQQITDGQTYSSAYAYNLSGALVEQTYPSGRIVKTVLDTSGNVSMVQSKKDGNHGFYSYAKNFTYNAAGAVTSMQLGNGRWESTQFNSRFQPTQIALGTLQSEYDLLKLNYTYDNGTATINNGNVMSQTITVPGMTYPLIQNYTYDSLNRLESAVETSNSMETWKQTYTFDRYGNRRFDFTNGNTTVPASNCTEAICNPTISTSNNRLTSSGWSYDNAGNTTADPSGQTFVYDAENKQVSAANGSGTLGEYSYDGDGKRVKKYVPSTGEVTVFAYDAAGKLIAEYSTQLSQTQQVNYLTSDHLGSPRINTDQNGAVIARHDYMPFGEEIDGTGGRTTGLNYGSDSVRKQFTGYERDTETDLDFAEARMYGNSLGRFTSPDPYNVIFEAEDAEKEKKGEGEKLFRNYISQPQNWDRYVYVVNNPLNYTDPTGEVIYLTGTEEEQKAALERIKNMLGPERSKLISVYQLCDAKAGYVTVIGLTAQNATKMDGIGSGDEGVFSVRMSDILQSKEVVEYRLSESFQTNDGRVHKTAEFGGAATVDKSESTTGNVQIFVHGTNAVSIAQSRLSSILGRTKSSDGGALDFTNEIIDSHEFGHAHEGMSGGNVNSDIGKYKAVQMENIMRGRQNGIVGPRRRKVD